MGSWVEIKLGAELIRVVDPAGYGTLTPIQMSSGAARAGRRQRRTDGLRQDRHLRARHVVHGVERFGLRVQISKEIVSSIFR